MTDLPTKADPARPYKALVAGAGAGLAFLAGVAGDGVSLVDGLGTAVAALVMFQSTYWVSNPSVPDEDG